MFGHFRTRATTMYGINMARERLRLDVPWSNEEILDVDRLSPTEIPSKNLYDIYKELGVGRAALMQLIEVGSFWLHHAEHGKTTKTRTYADANFKLIAAAACYISTQGQSFDNKEVVSAIAKRCSEYANSRMDHDVHI